MSEINDGGAAFPVTQAADRNGDIFIYAQEGMTLRDYFAAKAMQSAISNVADWKHMPEYIARISYKQADAMLKAREA